MNKERLIAKIVKTEKGNIDLVNLDGNVFQNVPPVAVLRVTQNNKIIQIRQQNDASFYIDPEQLKELQVLPAASVPFDASSTTIYDLLVLLRTDFFFDLGGGGSTDYIENVALVGGSLEFTAIGAAFGGTVPLAGLDTNFANTDLTLDDNRSHDFDGKYMLLNSTGFTSPVSTEPAFILDPLGGLFGAPIVGIKNGILSGINTTLLQQDDGSGLKTAISTQDSVGDVHRLEVNQGSVVISSTNGGDGNLISTDKSNGVEIQVESGELSINIQSADAVGKVLTLNNAVTKEVEFTDISGLGDNIYNQDGALTGDREVDIDGNELSFTNFQLLEISSGVNLEIQSQQASIEIDEDLEVSTQDTTLNSDNLDIITDIFRLNIPSADAVGKVLAVTNSTSKEVGFINAPATGGNAIFQEQDQTTTSAGALFVTRHTFNGNLDVGSYEISFFTYMGAGGAFAELRNGILVNGVVEYDRGFSTFFVVEQAYPNTFILDVTTAGVFDIQAQFRRVTAGITVDCNFSNLIIKKIA